MPKLTHLLYSKTLSFSTFDQGKLSHSRDFAQLDLFGSENLPSSEKARFQPHPIASARSIKATLLIGTKTEGRIVESALKFDSRLQ